MVILYLAGSSNGRTSAFEAEYLGSNPSPAALRLALLAQGKPLRKLINMYCVYIIKCEDSSLYTGITNDIKRRFLEHKNKTGGHYTTSHKVKKVVYIEEFKTKSEALKREIQIKKLHRKKKLELIKK